MSVIAIEENVVLESYQPVKKFLRFIRYLNEPVSALSRSISFFLQSIAKLKFIPLTLKFLHYLPIASSVIISIDNLSQIAVNLADDKRSTIQKTLNITHAVFSLILTVVFSFTPALPYAGLLASTITDFVFDAVFKSGNRIYKHFFGKTDAYRKEARELTSLLANEEAAYIKANEALHTRPGHIPYKKVIENIALVGSYEDKMTRLHSLNHEIQKSSAKLKEKAFGAALSTLSVTGAVMLLIPGLQPIGAGLLALAGTIYLTDKLFPLPFPWRKHLTKKPVKLEMQEHKDPGVNTSEISHRLTERQDPIVAPAPLSASHIVNNAPSAPKSKLPANLLLNKPKRAIDPVIGTHRFLSPRIN